MNCCTLLSQYRFFKLQVDALEFVKVTVQTSVKLLTLFPWSSENGIFDGTAITSAVRSNIKYSK